ncbi:MULTISPECIES: DUF4761 family protein [Enterobacteriaceae]|uniref:DUF4761 family protein n=1 Tax=Enterobacteriaceae TaxID=543 RepID=UPI001F2FD8CB|nr:MULTISPECIES: DUF4761 family protein [Enterobacteriaceae]
MTISSKLIKLGRHAYLYRGFTIQECPRNPFTQRASYTISSGGNHYGRDFALADAIRTVDNICRGGSYAK